MNKAIDRALGWIRQKRLPGRGIVVSSADPALYPEVTGYLIPNLLALGERDLALEWGRHLISIQRPDGAFTDPSGKAPYSFDTGQILRGLVALFEHSIEFEEPAVRATDWLLRAAAPSGRLAVPETPDAWSMGPRGSINEGVHLYCLPPIAAVGRTLSIPRFVNFATKSRDWYVANANVSDFRAPNALTHLFGYMQEALFDLGAEDVAARGMATLAEFQHDTGCVPAYHDVEWVCTPGQFQSAITWMKLGDRARAKRAIDFMTPFQNGSGGFFGSYGVGANYFERAEISWAVKFMFDALALEERLAAAPERPAVEKRQRPTAPRATVITAGRSTATPAPRTNPNPPTPALGKTLDSNLPPDEWHESITRGKSPAQIAQDVRRAKRPQWVETVLIETSPGESLLELGSGTGELSAHLAMLGRSTTLCDFSEKSLEFAAALYEEMKLEGAFVRGDVLGRLPFDDRSIDVVWSSGLLEHFTDDEIDRIVAESARVAKRRVIALVPNASSLPYRLGKDAQERGGRWIWGKETPKTSLRASFDAAGLRGVREYSIAPEHALNFLDAAESAPLRDALTAIFRDLPRETLASLNQGYLLVTVGEVVPAVTFDDEVFAARVAAARAALKTIPKSMVAAFLSERPHAPIPAGDPAKSETPAKPPSGPRRLVVLPNDPLEAYVAAGYPDLTEYFNPGRAFDEVFCVSPHERREYELYGIKVLPTPIAAFANRVQELGAVCVRAYDIPAGQIACAKRVPGVPIICSVHDVNPERCPGPLPNADLFLAISGAVENFLLTKGADRRRIRRFANRVNTDVFKPIDDAAKRAAFDARFPGKYRVVHVGRMTEQKNQDTLIRALAILGPEFTGIFIGKGDTSRYEALAEEWAARERCHFIDAVPNAELAEFYSFAECFCTPSRWEGFGIVFIEALAAGAVVVTSDIAPMNEYIVGDASGVLVRDYEDPVSLAWSVQRACIDQRLRTTLKANARAAAEPFSKERVDALEKEIYDDAVNGRLPASAPRSVSLIKAADTAHPAFETMAWTPDADHEHDHRPAGAQAGPAGANPQAPRPEPSPAKLARPRVLEAPPSKPRLHLLTRDLMPEWQEIVETSPDAWFYHTFAEQALLEEAWPSRSMSFMLEWNGKMAAICPLQRWKWDPTTLHSTIMGPAGPAFAAHLDAAERAHVMQLTFHALRELCDGHSVKKIEMALPPLSRGARATWHESENPLVAFGFTDRSTVTSVIDLSDDEDRIFSKFSATRRTDIRKAMRENVEVYFAKSPNSVDDYYALHVETYTRTGVKPHPRAYFDAIYRHFVATDHAYWLTARDGAKILGCVNLAVFGDASLYWTGAYSAEGLKRGVSKLLQWEAIRFAKAKGLRFHETGEIFPETRGSGTKEAGLTDYKRNFGGKAVPFRKGIYIAN